MKEKIVSFNSIAKQAIAEVREHLELTIKAKLYLTEAYELDQSLAVELMKRIMHSVDNLALSTEILNFSKILDLAEDSQKSLTTLHIQSLVRVSERCAHTHSYREVLTYLNRANDLDSMMLFKNLIDVLDSLVEGHQLTPAKLLLKAAIVIFPNEGGLRINLAYVYCQSKEFKAASELMYEALIQNPGSILFLFTLAQVYKSSGDLRQEIYTRKEMANQTYGEVLYRGEASEIKMYIRSLARLVVGLLEENRFVEASSYLKILKWISPAHEEAILPDIVSRYPQFRPEQ